MPKGRTPMEAADAARVQAAAAKRSGDLSKRGFAARAQAAAAKNAAMAQSSTAQPPVGAGGSGGDEDWDDVDEFASLNLEVASVEDDTREGIAPSTCSWQQVEAESTTAEDEDHTRKVTSIRSRTDRVHAYVTQQLLGDHKFHNITHETDPHDYYMDAPNAPSDTPPHQQLGLYGCKHYRRRCLIRAPCCSEIFSCRHCHDEVEVHQRCSGCGVVMGEYFCQICCFFDDEVTKGQFHCRDCGICRRGGRDKFFHCQTCGCCLAVQLQAGHTCTRNQMQRSCPICHEVRSFHREIKHAFA